MSVAPGIRREDLLAFVDEQHARATPAHPPFAPEEYAARHRRLREAMAEASLDVLVLSSPEAMFWLHGHRSRWYKAQSTTAWPPLQCTIVAVDDDRIVHVDSAEHEDLVRAGSIATDVRLFADEGLEPALGFLVGVLGDLGLLGRATGVEAWSPVPNAAVRSAIDAALTARGSRIEDASALVRAVRRIKSPAEIAVIEEAAHVCDAGLLGLRDALRPGMTELEGWAALVTAMAAAGGEPAALHELVHFGPIDMGHAISSRRELRTGDVILADPCGVVDRYHANVALPLVLGEPDPRAVALADLCGGAFDVLCSVARVGVSLREVNAELRAYYRDCGLWDRRAWTGGYELGVAFPPDWVGEWLFTIDDEDPEGVIEHGMVSNYESCVSFAMIDTVVYEETGTRTLSALPHGLLVGSAE